MLLSDPISTLLQIPPVKTIEDLKAPQDPEYFFDLKKLFRQNKTHWKNVKQYRHTHFAENHDNRYKLDGEINYIKDEVKLYHQDITFFCRSHPEMNSGEAAQAFCNKYRGYLNEYGIEWTERAIRRNQQ